MSAYSQRKLYRSRYGMIFGVCQGLADWKELPVGMVRLVTFIIFMATGVFPVLVIYLGLAFFLPVEPRDDDYRRGGGDDRDDSGPRNYRERKARKEKDWDQRFYDRR